MSTPQQFGDYLLFRQLSSDALGDTYRAGKIGGQGVERVVLLRQFNGQGVDRKSLWQALADRSGVHRALQNPHIGEGVDIGQVSDTPYVAYEYVSGKTLAELLAQTRARPFPIPIEHALFIAERVTFGLTAAFATRFRESRVQHGFLVPELIVLSNEGEVRVLGFEAGPALRQSLSAAPVREAFGRYLAPETAPGAPPTSAEDVFSLGAILFELLTGRTLAPAPDHNHEPLIDNAVVASEDAPLPPAIRALLKSSLTRKDNRIADVQQWQQALSRFISEGEYNPTTFNLAFFMHSLFRGEIERETVEIEKEKQTQVDVVIGPAELGARDRPVPKTSDVLVPPGAEEVAEETGTDGGEETVVDTFEVDYGPQQPKSKKGLLIAAGVVVAVAAGLLAAYFLPFGGTSEAPQEVAATQPQTPVEALPEATDTTTDPDALVAESVDEMAGEEATPAAEEPAAEVPSVEQMQSEIRRLVAAQRDELESTVASRYEKELEALRQQLEEARTANQPAEPEAPTEPPTEEVEVAAGENAAATTTARTAEPAPAQAADGGSTAPATQAAGQAAAGQGTQAAGTAPAQRLPPGQLGTQTPSAQPSTAVPSQPEREVATQPAPPPPPERVEVGDLVEPGADVVPPRMETQPRPRYPPSARALRKVATVHLRVLVDENGHVIDTQRVGGKVGFGFDESAMAAASRTTWRPATKNGVRVKIWVDLRIEFKP